MAEVEFTKERGKDRKDNWEVNLEEFIAVKGIKAQGNQLTTDKVNQISLIEALPYEAPEEIHAEDIEVIDETDLSDDENSQIPPEENDNNDDLPTGGLDEKGQITLF